MEKIDEQMLGRYESDTRWIEFREIDSASGITWEYSFGAVGFPSTEPSIPVTDRESMLSKIRLIKTATGYRKSNFIPKTERKTSGEVKGFHDWLGTR